MTYETGTEVFFIESNSILRKATVVRRSFLNQGKLSNNK